MFSRIAIVGLGLLGGSFALAMKKRFPGTRITAVGRSEQKLRPAVVSGMVDDVTASRTEGVVNAQLVVIGTPAASVAAVLAEIAPFIAPGTLITDFASTKKEIVAAGDDIGFPNAMFVGCHPIAGSEKTGFEHAAVDLFTDKTIVVTPTKHTKPEAVQLLTALWKDLSARPVLMSPEEHDRKLAVTSHLVHLAASALTATVSREDAFTPLIGSGFLDTTRVAKGDETMWTDIVKTNGSDILSALSRFKCEVNEIERMITEHEYDALFAYLKGVRVFRERI
ncbi:MAG: prephenate dehydrogenase [Spirochaetota bacterium]